uniref:Uncharacterized protein n=1 Tax=Romanomermis culicivorax TaxID=13658 RepID=A0A915IND2_ROMCU
MIHGENFSQTFCGTPEVEEPQSLCVYHVMRHEMYARMAAQMETSFRGYREYSFPHYQANPKRGRDISIPKVAPRDPGIDGGIPDIHTADEVRKFREAGPKEDQIKRLGRRKLARKANRAKKKDGEDVIEISDDEREKTGSSASVDSKFVGSTTSLTDSTKSKTRTTPMSQTPGTTSSISQVQSRVASAKIPSKSTGSQ